jgi:hypothetical protein
VFDHGPSLAPTPDVAASHRDPHLLQAIFRVLGYRRRGAVSFRRFVILHAQQSAADEHELRASEIATQPLRVSFW